MKKKEAWITVTALLGASIFMVLFEQFLQPDYWVKSGVKVLLFGFTGAALLLRFGPQQAKKLFSTRALGTAVLLGVGVFAVILAAYFLLRQLIDLDTIATNILGKGISRDNFLLVAAYICIVNSFLEEFFFRGIGCCLLQELMSKKAAWILSAAAFSLYHVGIMSGWFSIGLFALALLGLFVGGLLFNWLNRHGSLYPSWLVHCAANLAINSIGLIMFDIL